MLSLEGANTNSHKTIYIYKIILFLKKAVSRVEGSELCMRQETGEGVQNKKKSLVCHASYSNEPDTWTFECHW